MPSEPVASLRAAHGRLGWLVFDPRRYAQHRGRFLCADRIFVGHIWTPLVRVRTRLPRAADGGTEI